MIVRNSVFLADKTTTRADQFRAIQAENVTVVWLGDGTFPGTVPPGVTVTTDLSVWEQARAELVDRARVRPGAGQPVAVPGARRPRAARSRWSGRSAPARTPTG